MRYGKTITSRKSSKKTSASYSALQPSRARKALPWSVVSADKEFSPGTRNLAWNSAIDLEQNFTLPGFAVRTHLNFVSAFSFQARTDDDDFNALLEKWMTARTGKNSVDICRRMSLSTMIRTFAGLKVWFGDSAIIKLAGGKLQLIEAWQIAKGAGAPEAVNDNGLLLDQFGAVDQYAIARKPEATGELTHASLVPWADCEFDGYFTRANQTRGVSPLMPAINHSRDYLDAVNYHLITSKIAAMFGLVIFRDHSKKGRHDFDYSQQTAEEQVEDGPLKYDLKPGLKLELEQQDKAEFLQSRTPPAEFLAFGKHLCRLILAAIDLPYSVFDSEAANYSSMRADWNRYKLSAVEERTKNQGILDGCTEHIIRAGIADGSLKLPKKMTLDELDWEWVPTGTFILDLSKELDAILKKIGAGLMTRTAACKELGTGEFRDNAIQLGKEEKILKAAGVTIQLAQPGAITSDQGTQQP
jgi:hypothetical protein